MKDLQYLYDRSLLIVDFLLLKNPNDIFLKEARDIMLKTFERKNLKGMMTISRDMNAWAKVLSTEEKRNLEKLLYSKFGENLFGDKIALSVIDNILNRKSINNDEEYRIVCEYLNDIDETDEFYNQIDELVKFQNAYIK